MKYSADYDAWQCAGPLIWIKWVRKPRTLALWGQHTARVHPGDDVLVMVRPVGMLAVLVSAAPEKVPGVVA